MRHAHSGKTIIALAALGAAISMLNADAFASEPDYDERYAYRFEVMTGYPETEEGARRALANFYALDRDASFAAIAVVGEMRYTSLVPRLKELYALVPPFEVGFPNQTKRVWFGRSVFPVMYQRWNALIARALMRCGDEEVIPVVVDQVKHCREMEYGHIGLLLIRNVKYLVKLPNVNVINPLLTIIGDPPRVDWATYQAIRELRETDHNLRFTTDPRFPTFRRNTDRVLEAIDGELAKAIESATDEETRRNFQFYRLELDNFRELQPTWGDTLSLNAFEDMVWHDLPQLVEIIDHILVSQDPGQRQTR